MSRYAFAASQVVVERTLEAVLVDVAGVDRRQ